MNAVFDRAASLSGLCRLVFFADDSSQSVCYCRVSPVATLSFSEVPVWLTLCAFGCGGMTPRRSFSGGASPQNSLR
jgi:hypothetical protein